MKKINILILITVSFVLFISCNTIKVNRPQFIVNSINDDTEKKIIKIALKQILSTLKRDKNYDKQLILEDVGEVVCNVLNISSDIEYRIFSSNEIFVIYVPNEEIIISSGTFNYVNNDVSLAIVLFNSMLHSIVGHNKERLSDLLRKDGENKFNTVLNSGKITNQYANAVGVVTNKIELPYSLLHEKESDRITMNLLAKAGYIPIATSFFWTRFQQKKTRIQKKELQNKKINNFFLLNPVTQSRITNLNSNISYSMKIYKECSNKLKFGNLYRPSTKTKHVRIKTNTIRKGSKK